MLFDRREHLQPLLLPQVTLFDILPPEVKPRTVFWHRNNMQYIKFLQWLSRLF